jgi:hypothetical protein
LRQEVFTRLVARIRKIVEDDEALGMFGSHFYVVEVKGCKRLTKEVNGEQKEDGVKECLSNAWKNFLREFSCLSETHLLDRSRGEVFFDIGITFNPVTKDVPLVGLWRLDSLEATYGAGGYLTGNMHHLNTLELIGGLQAEMSNSRCERTHVVSRISYNLVYEVVRQMDNSRSLFDEKEACELDKGYFNDVDQVIDLFSGPATKASYGVRDEYRIGGQGLQDMIEAVDELVSVTDSRLWIQMTISHFLTDSADDRIITIHISPCCDLVRFLADEDRSPERCPSKSLSERPAELWDPNWATHIHVAIRSIHSTPDTFFRQRLTGSPEIQGNCGTIQNVISS